MATVARRAAWALCFSLAACLCPADSKPPAGPAAEKRFPPLKLPPGFRATLFACDPLIEYPSAIALGPRPRSLFVAIDYLTGLGTEIIRRDEIRLLEDTDGDGYADKATTFATGFNSIQGLAYHDGALYVMHAPYLSVLHDLKEEGKASRRRDLLTGLGLPPEEDQIRLHNANGVVVGHDGWLYLALGDRGCDVRRPEGDRLVLHGGGILRCRPDGRDLHVFSRGLRNVYDVALDEELNVLLRDNENDGGDYKIRVCHSFFGADHGYPNLYHERPTEALPPLADLGLGSSAGAACYLERQFPAEYRGGVLFCEWGRAVVRYPLKRKGASFAPARENDFAWGAANDPYGFKPTDLAIDRDGSLFVADWADGQRPRRGRGRIYRIRYVGSKKEKSPAKPRRLPPRPDDQVARLDSDSHAERSGAQQALERRGKQGAAAVAAAMKAGRLGVRGRLHGVWVIAKAEGPAALEKLLAVAEGDESPRVQAQAVRAVADLADPVLIRHRLAAASGDEKLARRLAVLAVGKGPQVRLEVVVALGRMRWVDAPSWLRTNLKKRDPVLDHAAQGAMRQAGNWPAVLKLLDEPSSESFRPVALRAAAGQYAPELVEGLIERLKEEPDPARRIEYADALARVCRKPGPWSYWGFRPAPRPANPVAWKLTRRIEKALTDALAGAKRIERLAILKMVLREKVQVQSKALSRWLEEEREPDAVAALLTALRGAPAGEARSSLERVLRDPEQTKANRLLAAAIFLEGLAGGEDRLPAVAAAVEDGPILAELLLAAGARKVGAASKLVLRKLSSPDAAVRAAAARAVAELGSPEAAAPVSKLLTDGDARVRAAAASTAARLALRGAGSRILKMARDPDAEVRKASLEALRRLREPRALPEAVAALGDPQTAVQALDCVGELGGPDNAGAVAGLARRTPSAEVLAAAGKVLAGWAARKGLPARGRRRIERALAEVHGGSGVLLGWQVRGPLSEKGADLASRVVAGRSLPTGKDPAPGWRLVLSTGLDARVRLAAGREEGSWLAYGEAFVQEQARVEFFTSSSAPATVWLNGKVVHRRDAPGVPGPYPERFEATLVKGGNRLLVRLAGVMGPAKFQLRFRRQGATAEQERLARAALSRAGNPEAGRKVFLNAEKSLCVKCHRVGEQGERVGPELTGLGSRFSKAYIIESILEPSRTVSPSFESTLVELKSGKALTGVKVVETETSITLVDSEAKRHVIARSRIEATRKQPGSSMPEGLEKRLSEDEFVDLVSFLVNLKGPRR
jgi:putative membrane-bound dehydrogenase-like protein